jgi:thiamine-monophosphate kinase
MYPILKGMRNLRANRLNENGLTELGLIERLRARTAKGPGQQVRIGIGDDCALLRPRPGEEIAVTTDLSIEGRHFRLDWHSPESVGHRALARGLSDLAAMGARPMAAFLSLGLPRELVQPEQGRRAKAGLWVERFYDGLLALAEAHKTPLAGGDLAEAQLATADIVLIGAVPHGKALLRSGARPGDLLYVTGSLGGSAAALEKLAELTPSRKRGTARRSAKTNFPRGLEALLSRQLYPQPRVTQGLWLMRRGLATAALDLSDGLSTDLLRLCRESGVGAEVEAAALPVHPGATLEQALNGGEDYELLFTARPGTKIPQSIAGVAVTRIGRILRTPRQGARVMLGGAEWKRPLEARGWEHFATATRA